MTKTASDLRDLLEAAAAGVRPLEPLRVLVTRRAPLTSQGKRLGLLDGLLRVSCHDDGRHDGVLVFEWPVAAHGHSVVHRLEQFRDAGEHASEGLKIECRAGSMRGQGQASLPSVHLKVGFDLTAIAEQMGELLDLAGSMGFVDPVREELATYGIETAESAPAQAGDAAPAIAVSAAEQEQIDRITNHARFDSGRHPHVVPNTEVTNSNGEVFRLVMRHTRNGLVRQWVRVATSAHGDALTRHSTTTSK